VICSFLLAACALLSGGDEPVTPLTSGLVRSIELGAEPGTWVQHFRLDKEGTAPAKVPLGLLRYVAGPVPGGGLRVELELEFLADDVRLIDVEELGALGRRVVYRELGARTGRTLFLEGTPKAGFAGYELGGPSVVHHEDLGDGALPLVLIESVRRGAVLPERAPVLDPLAASFETLTLRLEGAGDTREFEARRADGSLRWRVNVSAGRLEAWRFQEGGPLARAISAAEFEALRGQVELERSTAREAAARAEDRARTLRARPPAR
jgi:hypothetical protein